MPKCNNRLCIQPIHCIYTAWSNPIAGSKAQTTGSACINPVRQLLMAQCTSMLPIRASLPTDTGCRHIKYRKQAEGGRAHSTGIAISFSVRMHCSKFCNHLAYNHQHAFSGAKGQWEASILWEARSLTLTLYSTQYLRSRPQVLPQCLQGATLCSCYTYATFAPELACRERIAPGCPAA